MKKHEIETLLIPIKEKLKELNKEQGKQLIAYLIDIESIMLVSEKMYKQVEKAKKWDELKKEIGACYENEDGTENTDPDIDLGTIGLIAAKAIFD